MTEGKLECSYAEQMELAAPFSADLIGPLVKHHNVSTEFATSGSFESDHRHVYMHPKAYIANCLSHGVENL